jgi:hypothetical protein
MNDQISNLLCFDAIYKYEFCLKTDLSIQSIDDRLFQEKVVTQSVL